ncbi:MAG: hypothetical protein U0P81_00785 [Holophagaceae bacterium]
MQLPAFVPEADARVTHLRAAMTRMVRASMAGAVDLRAWAELVAGLEPEARALAEADQELPEWVPIEAVTAWISAFSKAHGNLPRGRSIADQLLEHAHPWIQRALDPVLAAEALPKVFQHYHRGGVARLEALGPERAVLDLWAFVPYPGWHDALLPGVLHRAVERCGGEAVAVRILPPAEGDPFYHHRYEITWRAPAAPPSA